MEVAVPFFMGKLDVSDTYCDDYKKIAIQYLSSPSGFWFDFFTSLPWSFNDLYTLQATPPPPPPAQPLPVAGAITSYSPLLFSKIDHSQEAIHSKHIETGTSK
jgi:hypothetical protein